MPTRDYQAEDIGLIFKQFEEVQSTLYLAATGLGKTFVMAEVAKAMLPGRTILLCHRSELVFQAHAAFMRAGMECQIEKAELSASTNLFTRAPVVIATVQTLASGKDLKQRVRRFDPKDFSLLLYDETHHSVSPKNKALVKYFTGRNRNIRVLGVTASADRLDEESLGQIFESVASVRDFEFGISNGWLVPFRPLCLRVEDMDISHVHTTAGDLNSAELAAVMESEKPLYGVAQGTLEAAFFLEPNVLHGVPVEHWSRFLLDPQTPPRSTLAFTVSVAQAEMLCDIFNRVVPGIAEWVCGKTLQASRDDINARFKNGELPMLVNCGTHTEGVDVPRAEVIVPKPTKSRSLAIQMYGRGGRPAQVDGKSMVDFYMTAAERKAAIAISRKPHCTIVDFYGVTGRHKLITPFDILGGKASQEVIAIAIERAREKGTAVDMTEEMVEAEKELQRRMAESRARESARKNKLVGRARFTVGSSDLFNASDVAPMKSVDRHEGKVVTPGMAKILQRAGYDPYSMPYKTALQIMQKTFGRWNKQKQQRTK